jgi:hypothetical protein
MDFPNIDDNYDDAKYKAETFYKSIGKIWCPALDDFIILDDVGFSHLIKKGRLPRPKGEQKRRFFILRYMKNILSTKEPVSTDVSSVSKVLVRYWKFIDTQEGNTVKIVIRQFNNEEKRFLSIYGRIKKPRNEA